MLKQKLTSRTPLTNTPLESQKYVYIIHIVYIYMQRERKAEIGRQRNWDSDSSSKDTRQKIPRILPAWPSTHPQGQVLMYGSGTQGPRDYDMTLTGTKIPRVYHQFGPRNTCHQTTGHSLLIWLSCPTVLLPSLFSTWPLLPYLCICSLL